MEALRPDARRASAAADTQSDGQRHSSQQRELMEAAQACLDHHAADAGRRRLCVRTLEAEAQLQRAIQQASSDARLLQSRPFASVDATLVIHADKAAAHNLPTQHQVSAGAMLERLVVEVHGPQHTLQEAAAPAPPAKAWGPGEAARCAHDGYYQQHAGLLAAECATTSGRTLCDATALLWLTTC